MSISRSLTVISSIVCMLVLSSATLACACCADRGTYDVWTGSIDSYHLGLFKGMKFDGKAELFETDAGFATIKGLAASLENDSTDDMNLTDSYNNKIWHIGLKTVAGTTGALVLPLPARMTISKIDIPADDQADGEISLYKEFVFNGTITSGTGFFSKGLARPASYTLRFQGRGNMCDNAEDFTHWRLEVKGPLASYSLFGKMKPQAS